LSRVKTGLVKSLSAEDRDWLSQRFGRSVFFDEPLGKHTSFGVGGPASALVKALTVKGLSDLVRWTGEKNLPYFVLGKGTNLLVRDKGISGVVIRLSGDFNLMEEEAANDGVLIRAGAGVMLAKLCFYAVKNGLEGLNFGVGIPGTVGGAILMNAGTHEGCVADSIREVRVMDNLGTEQRLAAGKIAWGYRTMDHGLESKPGRPVILTGGSFLTRPADPEVLQKQAKEHLERRKATQPQGVRSAGSFFKNPPDGPSAGALIDEAGLKGKTIGGAMVSTVHANWIVNTGKATASEILALMELVQEEVLNKHGVSLEPEVKIVGA
jgi:UDP-N-acetylmuramate dehydrogenase